MYAKQAGLFLRLRPGRSWRSFLRDETLSITGRRPDDCANGRRTVCAFRPPVSPPSHRRSGSTGTTGKVRWDRRILDPQLPPRGRCGPVRRRPPVRRGNPARRWRRPVRRWIKPVWHPISQPATTAPDSPPPSRTQAVAPRDYAPITQSIAV
jgi:hypothetical protein